MVPIEPQPDRTTTVNARPSRSMADGKMPEVMRNQAQPQPRVQVHDDPMQATHQVPRGIACGPMLPTVVLFGSLPIACVPRNTTLPSVPPSVPSNARETHTMHPTSASLLAIGMEPVFRIPRQNRSQGLAA